MCEYNRLKETDRQVIIRMMLLIVNATRRSGFKLGLYLIKEAGRKELFHIQANG